MPRPGEARAARLTVTLRDRIWSGLYLPIGAAVVLVLLVKPTVKLMSGVK